MTKPVTIGVSRSFEVDAGLRAHEAERAVRNRAAWAAARKPSGPADIRVGDLIVLEEPYWQRGPGRVDEVDALGNVWAIYGQRENPHPSDSKTIRCFCPWNEVRIVPRA